MVSFQKRQTNPEKGTVIVRLGKGDDTRTIEYNANFDYTVSQPDGNWLKAVSDPKAGTITFTSTPNSGATVRTGSVTVSPKDNPGFVCTTFQVLQATDQLTIDIDPECPFAFDPQNKTLDFPAEGGDADIWVTYSKELTASVGNGVEWASAEISATDGFYRLRIHVNAKESEESREGEVQLMLGNAPIGKVTIIQR